MNRVFFLQKQKGINFPMLQRSEVKFCWKTDSKSSFYVLSIVFKTFFSTLSTAMSCHGVKRDRWHNLAGVILLRILIREAVAFLNRCCVYVWTWDEKWKRLQKRYVRVDIKRSMRFRTKTNTNGRGLKCGKESTLQFDGFVYRLWSFVNLLNFSS